MWSMPGICIVITVKEPAPKNMVFATIGVTIQYDFRYKRLEPSLYEKTRPVNLVIDELRHGNLN